MSKLTKTYLVAGQIDPTAFRGLTNLVELDLSGNLLTSVPTPTFSGTVCALHRQIAPDYCCQLAENSAT